MSVIELFNANHLNFSSDGFDALDFRNYALGISLKS